jgi:Cu(I)/Ag(I) efflux system membrane fusion protein
MISLATIRRIDSLQRRGASRGLAIAVVTTVLLSACGRDDGTRDKAAHEHGSPAGATTPAPGDAAQSHYTCPMHPSVHSPVPGQCPICGMNLVAVSRGSRSAEVALDSEKARRIGVRTERVEETPFIAETRTVGRVVYDESRLMDVSLKYEAFVEQLYADTLGRRVEKGQPLLSVYSPELYAGQQELLTALASRRTAHDAEASRRASLLVDAAKQRLRLWDLSDETIDAIARAGTASRTIIVNATTGGTIVEKDVVVGARVEPGSRIFRIADLSTVWVEADVYEADARALRAGERVRIVIPHRGAEVIDGEVSFVYPWLEEATRTARVRIVVDNASGDLKPDMFAEVIFETSHGERLTIPESAVLYAGDTRYVFVEVAEGRYQPRAVRLGARSNRRVVVEEGLMTGEHVVVAGTFLIAAESRLKVALEDW